VLEGKKSKIFLRNFFLFPPATPGPSASNTYN